jgi:DNA repair exonuclease SbcCD ATPase subunit
MKVFAFKERHPDDTRTTTMEVKEHFDADISVLLQDKQRLQEQLETARVTVQQLEENVQTLKQISIDNDHRNELHDNERRILKDLNDEYQQRIQLLDDELNREKMCQQVNISSLTDELTLVRTMLGTIRTCLSLDESTDLVERVEQLFNERQVLIDETAEKITYETNKINNEWQQRLTDMECKHRQTLEITIDDADKRVRDLNEQLQRISDTKDHIQHLFDEQQTTFKSEIQCLKQSNDEHCRLSEEYQRQYNEHRIAHEQWKQEKDNEHELQTTILRDENTCLRKQIVDIERVRNDLETNVNSRLDDNDVDVIRREYDEQLCRLRDQLSTNNEHHQNMLKEKLDQLESKQTEIDRLDRTIESFRTECTQLTDRIQQMTITHGTLIAEQRAELERLTVINTDKHDELARMKVHVDEHDQQWTQINEQYRQATANNQLLLEQASSSTMAMVFSIERQIYGRFCFNSRSRRLRLNLSNTNQRNKH